MPVNHSHSRRLQTGSKFEWIAPSVDGSKNKLKPFKHASETTVCLSLSVSGVSGVSGVCVCVCGGM